MSMYTPPLWFLPWQSWSHDHIVCVSPVCALASAPIEVVADGTPSVLLVPLGFFPPSATSVTLLGGASARGGGELHIVGQGEAALVGRPHVHRIRLLQQ